MARKGSQRSKPGGATQRKTQAVTTAGKLRTAQAPPKQKKRIALLPPEEMEHHDEPAYDAPGLTDLQRAMLAPANVTNEKSAKRWGRKKPMTNAQKFEQAKMGGYCGNDADDACADQEAQAPRKRYWPGLKKIMNDQQMNASERARKKRKSVLSRPTERTKQEAKRQRKRYRGPGEQEFILDIQKLPENVRKQIWRASVVRTKGFIWPAGDTMCQEQPDLAQVCRNIRQEVLQIFYTENTFAFAVPRAQCNPEPDHGVFMQGYAKKGPMATFMKWTSAMENGNWLGHIRHWVFECHRLDEGNSKLLVSLRLTPSIPLSEKVSEEQEGDTEGKFAGADTAGANTVEADTVEAETAAGQQDKRIAGTEQWSFESVSIWSKTTVEVQVHNSAACVLLCAGADTLEVSEYKNAMRNMMQKSSSSLAWKLDRLVKSLQKYGGVLGDACCRSEIQ